MNRLEKIKYIVFEKSKYDSENDFWQAIGQQIKLLTDNRYIALIIHEDYDIYRIEYYYADKELGEYYPIPLLPEEEEIIDSYKNNA
jgi:hypothetical protein